MIKIGGFLLLFTIIAITVDAIVSALGGNSLIWSSEYIYDSHYCNGPSPGTDIRCTPSYQVCKFFICAKSNATPDNSP